MKIPTWAIGAVIVIIIFLTLGCVHNDGWSQDEIDWVINNVR